MTLHGQGLGIAQIAGYSYVQNAAVVAINAQNVKNIASIKHRQPAVRTDCGPLVQLWMLAALLKGQNRGMASTI